MALAKTAQTKDNLDVEANGERLLKTVTVISGQSLARGEVYSVTGINTAGTATADAGNTGNGTVSAVTVDDNAIAGTYRLIATAADTFIVVDPNGVQLYGAITVGSAYDGVLNLTITAGGTPFVAGDEFTVAVTEGAGKATAYTSALGAAGVMYDTVDASAGDVNGLAYRRADLKVSEVDFGTGTDAEIREQLDRVSIFVRD